MRHYQPSLETERLRLRPFLAEDAEPVQDLAGMREIADTALSIHHPYSIDAAKAWISGQVFSFRQSTSLHFAIALQESGELIVIKGNRSFMVTSAESRFASFLERPDRLGHLTLHIRPLL